MKAHVRLRPGSHGEHTTGILEVPEHIMRHLVYDLAFQPEITHDGILYRVINVVDEDELPDWVSRIRKER